jgi:hypothetical protein
MPSPKKDGATPKGAPRGTDRKRFGRPGTAGKGEGDEAVAAWIAGTEAAHRGTVTKLDALLRKTVPNVKCAVKWSMALYGVEGRGFFAHLAAFKGYVAIGFYEGAALKPQPPEGEGKTMRRLKIRSEADYDERQLKDWIKQAASMQGWGMV